MTSKRMSKKTGAIVLSLAIVAGAVAGGAYIAKVSAASKPSVKKAVTVTAGKTTTLAIKKSGFSIKSVTVKSSNPGKAMAQATKKNVVIGGIAEGKATVTVAIKAKKGKKTKTYKTKVAVTVKAAEEAVTPAPSATPVATAAPTASAAASAAPTASAAATATPAATASVAPSIAPSIAPSVAPTATPVASASAAPSASPAA